MEEFRVLGDWGFGKFGSLRSEEGGEDPARRHRLGFDQVKVYFFVMESVAFATEIKLHLRRRIRLGECLEER